MYIPTWSCRQEKEAVRRERGYDLSGSQAAAADDWLRSADSGKKEKDERFKGLDHQEIVD